MHPLSFIFRERLTCVYMFVRLRVTNHTGGTDFHTTPTGSPPNWLALASLASLSVLIDTPVIALTSCGLNLIRPSLEPTKVGLLGKG